MSGGAALWLSCWLGEEAWPLPLLASLSCAALAGELLSSELAPSDPLDPPVEADLSKELTPEDLFSPLPDPVLDCEDSDLALSEEVVELALDDDESWLLELDEGWGEGVGGAISNIFLAMLKLCSAASSPGLIASACSYD